MCGDVELESVCCWRLGESECDKEIKKMKDTRLREIEDHTLKVEISRVLSLLIYNITLHKFLVS